ncbi:adipolin [Austrofundulus limnaeus]|uniref:Adipolin n=1 Tax=Austrofundulus limnaeus TaxID=52670 RepID=A0A2I4DD10_AUSLI|nr:PREDICTED: adipolin-like [Austrofundulus limnaeus]
MPSDLEQTLQRGQTFNSSSGRFLAPLSGFYLFTASLLIESRDRVQVQARDTVRAAICIESLCLNKLSVQSVTGAAGTGGTFSILLTGTLYLQVGEYVSLFVDNSTGSSISILKDSQFSGILLGV